MQEHSASEPRQLLILGTSDPQAREGLRQFTSLDLEIREQVANGVG